MSDGGGSSVICTAEPSPAPALPAPEPAAALPADEPAAAPPSLAGASGPFLPLGAFLAGVVFGCAATVAEMASAAHRPTLSAEINRRAVMRATLPQLRRALGSSRATVQQ